MAIAVINQGASDSIAGTIVRPESRFSGAGRAVLAAWMVSIGIHAGLFAGMLLLVLPYEPSSAPEADYVRASVIGDIDGDAFAPSPMPEFPVRPDLFAKAEQRFTASVPNELAIIPAIATDSRASTPGPGEGSSAAGGSELKIIGIGTGGGEAVNIGQGIGSGLGGGPQFFGLGGKARGVRSIVYVVDRSGSMMGLFGGVREELKRSISALRRSQKFHVIFFSSGEPLESPPRKPVSAIEAQKMEFFKFLENIEPGGSTRPDGAMRRAFDCEPDLIYFLTDGLFSRSLLARLEEWNRDRKVRIYTIAYVDPTGAELLEQIAREHGGEYKYVTENDLP